MLLSYDPAITIFGIYSKELKHILRTHKTQINKQKKTPLHMWLFIEALFIIDKTWTQPRCPSAGE